ncbi:hypothetical protein QR680_001676 [Steinernema hermaphroditum]|uniref:Mitochondria-eating protein n=1 Tax=Steinernema hermaphroditum TaxID=289476 RepID=A0AA39GZF8_9BILA|nr:hypothetical protein QR680_001676 [Steinernema hermaphroditum]
MQNKIIRAVGWSFQSPLSNLMILFDDAQLSDLIDSNSIHHLIYQIRNIESDDLGTFLKLIPPLSELTKTLPQSLPLLDLIYSKCEKLKRESGVEFPALELCCAQLVQQVLWWLAFHHESNKPSASQTKIFSQHNDQVSSTLAFPFNATVRAHLRSIFGVIGRECPSILEDAVQDKVLLEDCLESLGCHGLVNCSTGLIRIFDAVALELLRHQERVKASQQKLKELQKMKSVNEEVPSKSSHQRQMSLTLSEVFDRLKQNESIVGVLEKIVNNQHLSSLLRIVKKRVHSDKVLLNLFNTYSKNAPEGFSFREVNPVIAKLIVAFKNIGNHDFMYGRLRPRDFACYPPDHFSEMKLQVNTLKYELGESKKKIRLLELQNKNLSLSCPKPDYCGASQYYACSTDDELRELTSRFQNLYEANRNTVMEALNELPEFTDSEELKSKTIFSVMVLTFRSVQDTVSKKRDRVWDILDTGENSDRTEMDNALYRFLFKEAQSQHGMQNAKEVTSQIWAVLYDFPSLKTCTCFNRFILDCVDVVWCLVAGINGNKPRMRIQYESYQFDASKHSRHPTSNMRATVIKRVHTMFLAYGLLLLSSICLIVSSFTLEDNMMTEEKRAPMDRSSMVRFGRAPMDRSSMVRFGKRAPMDRSSMVRFGKRAPMDRSSMVRFGKRAPMDRSAMVRFGKRAPMDRSSMVRFGKRTSDVQSEE